jgi:hypothetical protein
LGFADSCGPGAGCRQSGGNGAPVSGEKPDRQALFLYTVAILGIYMGYVGLQLLWPGFPGQCGIAVLAAMVSVGAVVLERLSRDSKAKFLIAQIMASASLIVGMLNAFL